MLKIKNPFIKICKNNSKDNSLKIWKGRKKIRHSKIDKIDFPNTNAKALYKKKIRKTDKAVQYFKKYMGNKKAEKLAYIIDSINSTRPNTNMKDSQIPECKIKNKFIKFIQNKPTSREIIKYLQPKVIYKEEENNDYYEQSAEDVFGSDAVDENGRIYLGNGVYANADDSW